MGSCVAKKSQLDTISPRQQISLEALQQYFEDSRVDMNAKLHPYFQKALDKRSKGEAELAIKFIQLGGTQSEHLARVLPFYSNLKSLRLWKTRLGVEGARTLAPALTALRHLEMLSLEDNQLQTEGVQLLAVSLKQLSRLQSLILHVNQINSEGGKALAAVCSSHTKLQELLLSENYLGAVGMAALAAGLLACAGSLRVLELAHNSLQQQGGQHLLQVLPRLPVLEKVVLTGNQLGEVLEREMFHKAPTVHFYF